MISALTGWLEDRKARGLLAASLYEPLAPEDAAYLARRMEASPSLRRDAAELGALVKALPVQPIAFTGDLRPVLRETLRPSAPSRGWIPAPAYGVALFVVFAAGFAGTGAYLWRAPAPAVDMLAANTFSPVAPLLVEAQRLAADRDYGEAVRVLQRGLEQHPSDRLAGRAQALLADIEFTHFRRYPRAYQAYETLRTAYNDTFASDPRYSLRFEMLDEARAKDYAPLYALDTARQDPKEAFAQLEQIVAQYPATYVARLALEEMAEHAGVAPQNVPGLTVAQLEQIRDKCNEPVVVGFINHELGQSYWHGMNDLASARACFEKAIESPDQNTRQLAQTALAQLQVPPAQ